MGSSSTAAAPADAAGTVADPADRTANPASAVGPHQFPVVASYRIPRRELGNIEKGKIKRKGLKGLRDIGLGLSLWRITGRRERSA